ncbi:hypothetical protein [Chitinophaga sedimenti]
MDARIPGNEGNRLLKLIEEPPPKTIFVLVAENQNRSWRPSSPAPNSSK